MAAIGTICYFANGPKKMPKEYLEVYKDGQSATLLDFRELVVIGPRGVRKKKLFSQDKGQGGMVNQFISAVRAGQPSPIPFAEIDAVTEASFLVMRALRDSAVVAMPGGDLAKQVD